MLSNQTFYHGVIRKTIVAFGSLFSNIYIDRKSGGSVEGTTVQRLQIPIAHGPKEKWIVRLDQDPALLNNVYTTLPRMSFEILGYSYDATRKLNKMNKIICHGGGSMGPSTVYTPVPYNITVVLYIITKTLEDAMQIVEQILPTFSPEYVVTINAIPDMNITQDIPVVLTGINVQDDYEGDFATRRFVVHTLTFDLKINLYGNITDRADIIHTAIANVSQNEDMSAPRRHYVAQGNIDDFSVESELWTDEYE